MLFGLFLRNYKVYNGWHYIPLSNGDKFSALVGDNGVGKSSVLEALDVFFNRPLGAWNYHHSVSKSGVNKSKPSICPIFMLRKDEFNKNSNLYKYLNTISDLTWQIETEDFSNDVHKKSISKLCMQINTAKTTHSTVENDYFLIPCGFEKESENETKHSIGILGHFSAYEEDFKNDHNTDLEEAIISLYSAISEKIEYIHIPSEIDYESYTKIEGKTIQSLMGTNVDSIIKEFIDDSIIKKINLGLDEFLKNIETKLEKYEYKKPAKRQTLFNLTHLTSKIIETYFESKILNLKNGSTSTPIYHFSSGEKRRAIIDLAQAFVTDSSRSGNRKSVILSIDEPEVSLHTSACYSQFKKLEEISLNGIQTIVSTHWYGFLTAVSGGNASYISCDENNEKHSFLINLKRFREDISEIKKTTCGQMPTSIELKSINDLVQSIISSIYNDNTHWIICEGYSDRIYLEHYLKDYPIHIISVGGSKYVKKFYEYLYLALEDDRSSIKGKIYLLLDTDKQHEKYISKSSIKSITIKRLQNNHSKKSTELLETSSDITYPPTEIEDVLRSKCFFETMKLHLNETDGFNNLKEIFSGEFIYDENHPAGIAFDYRDSQKADLEAFFNIPGKKVSFALDYCSNPTQESTPKWINEIVEFLDIKEN